MFLSLKMSFLLWNITSDKNGELRTEGTVNLSHLILLINVFGCYRRWRVHKYVLNLAGNEFFEPADPVKGETLLSIPISGFPAGSTCCS